MDYKAGICDLVRQAGNSNKMVQTPPSAPLATQTNIPLTTPGRYQISQI